MSFRQFTLSDPILRAVRDAGYTSTTPIQAQAIQPVLDGHDVLGCAQTGTGKTAAFSLPILQRLSAAQAGPRAGRGRAIRALVVAPTRELAAQIDDSLRTYGRHLPLRSTVIFGGVNQHRQVEALRRGVDILVATPGRLLDLVDQGHIRLGRVEVLVLDEADRMLDMGFIHDIRKIVALVPEQRQTLLFSATMPPEIRGLAATLLHEPVEVSVAPQSTAAETVTQRVYLVAREDKQALLTHLLRDDQMSKALVFTRTKHGADRVARKLTRASIEAAAIHGNKSQNARLRALDSFRRGATRVLVASDIAARGLDIDEVSHVVNFDLPNEPETYVHRIGRTGRAGARGIAISFCADEERGFLRSIERLVRKSVPVVTDHPYHASFSKMPLEDRPARAGARAGRGPSRRRSGPGRGPAAPARGETRGSGERRAASAGEQRTGRGSERPARQRTRSRGRA